MLKLREKQCPISLKEKQDILTCPWEKWEQISWQKNLTKTPQLFIASFSQKRTSGWLNNYTRTLFCIDFVCLHFMQLLEKFCSLYSLALCGTCKFLQEANVRGPGSKANRIHWLVSLLDLEMQKQRCKVASAKFSLKCLIGINTPFTQMKATHGDCPGNSVLSLNDEESYF